MSLERLFLLRHAHAADPRFGEPDAARPLTDEGYQALDDMLALLSALEVRPDAVLHSPAVRTTETARAARERLAPDRPLIEVAEAGLGHDVRLMLLAVIATGHRRPLVVGHEPQLGEVLSLQLGAPRQPFSLRKAGFAELRFHHAPGGEVETELRRLLSPREARAARRGT
jgi:phosphohistidine phosphatase